MLKKAMFGVVLGLAIIPVTVMAMTATSETGSSNVQIHTYVKSITTTTHKASFWTGKKIVHVSPKSCALVVQKLVSMKKFEGVQLPTIDQSESPVACPGK
jgi:hypothetical protein